MDALTKPPPAKPGKPPFGKWKEFIGRRTALGWTQKETAEHFGVNQSTISDWETKERRPTLDYLGPIADWMEIPQGERYDFLLKFF